MYVRDESPPGLALVTNALSTVDKRGGNNMLNHTHGGAPTPNLAEKKHELVTLLSFDAMKSLF